jgi:hypothetical protein
MIEKIEELRKKYAEAISDEEKEWVNAETSKLYEQDPDGFVEAMMCSIDAALRRARELSADRKPTT